MMPSTLDVDPLHFRPRTHRQVTVLNVASRFDDLRNLARYLNVCDRTQAELLEAARVAEQRAFRDGTSPVDAFFALLEDWSRKEAT